MPLIANYCFSLILFSSFRLVDAEDSDYSLEMVWDVSFVFCKVVAYLVYYLGISMFFWMSVMCFDLCWTFVRARIPRKGSDSFKFALYSLVAWGMPLILLTFLVLVDNDSKLLKMSHATERVIKERLNAKLRLVNLFFL